MTPLILLDTGPLGLVTHPKGGEDARSCREWLLAVIGSGALVRVPAIADYELRRELTRSKKSEGLSRLDLLVRVVGYLPLTREALELAANLWAPERQAGRPKAPDFALDGDCILAAQALTAENSLPFELSCQDVSVIVATTNPKHLDRHTDARLWSDIRMDGPGPL